MNRELVINVTPSEITIALCEDKVLVELSKEQCQTGFAVGDIYLGKVRKIMPGLNAAFVNIGHEKDAFIHGDADKWAAMNSVKVWEQMRRMGIGCDLHTLVKRPHCFEFKASPGTGSYTWLDRIWEFMNHKGFNN